MKKLYKCLSILACIYPVRTFPLEFALIAKSPDKLLTSSIIATVNANASLPTYFQHLRDNQVASTTNLTWQGVGPGAGGSSFLLYSHPWYQNYLFMSGDMGSTYRSTDKGATWESIIDEDSDGVDMVNMSVFHFSTNSPNRGYAGGRKGLYRTGDAGASWVRVGAGVLDTHVSAVTIAEDDPTTVFVGTGHKRSIIMGGSTSPNSGRLYRSYDNGGAWTKITPPVMDSEATVIKFALSSLPAGEGNRRILAATTRGIYRSDDDGNNWWKVDLLGSGLPHEEIIDMDSMEVGGTLHLWVLLRTHISQSGNNEPVFTGGIFHSANNGSSWMEVDSSGLRFDINDLSALAGWRANRYFNSLSIGLDRPLSEVETYPLSSSALQNFSYIQVNHGNTNEIYLGVAWNTYNSFEPYGIWKTSDAGTNQPLWQIVTRLGSAWTDNEGYFTNRLQTIAENVTQSLFQHKLWMHAPFELLDVRGFTMSKKTPSLLYFSAPHHIYCSEDSGGSWEQTDNDEVATNEWQGRGNSIISAFGVTFLPGTFDVYLQGADQCVMITRDRGLTFDFLEQREHWTGDGDSLAFDPSSNALYLGKGREDVSAGGFFKSIDAGASYTRLSTPITDMGAARSIPSVVLDLVSRDNIYICNASLRKNLYYQSPTAPGQGVKFSDDGGVTWSSRNYGFGENKNVIELLRHPSDPVSLYAGLKDYKVGGSWYYGGLFKSVDGGMNWNRLPLPDDAVAVNDIHIDATTHDLYVACGQFLVKPFAAWEYAGGVWKSTDDGRNWTKIFWAPFCTSVATSPHDSNLVMVSSAVAAQRRLVKNPGVFLSENGGATWAKVNQGLMSPQWIRGLQINPAPGLSNEVWAGSFDSGWKVGMLNLD